MSQPEPATSAQRDVRPREEKRRAALADRRPRRTISFYRYVRIADPAAFRERLLAAWSGWDCLGRIYVASEGINAQMSVPLAHWEAFDAWTQAQPELAGVPYKVAVEEGEVPSFYKLTIKLREKIVADGLDDRTFDVTNTGEYLTAEEMNAYLDDPEAIVVDMRNAYESEVGHFAGALTPQVETFREELQVVPRLLAAHKDKPIALYCTGGIRCEKASAWLQHQGFANVRHLQGGIIEYAHQVKERGLPNRFRGKNFVFDERLGERVSDEVIARCHLCRTAACDTHHHCQNQICHTLYIGCPACVASHAGYCSRWCRMSDRLPARVKKSIARYYNQFIRRRRPFRKTRLA